MKKSRQGFTLIEMMVVIGIIAAMSVGITMIRVDNASQDIYAAQRSMMTAFYEARSTAMSRQTDARVIIYRGPDDGRKLRQVGVIYKVTDEDGVVLGWKSLNNGFVMTRNVFFVPDGSNFASYVKVGKGYNDGDIFKSTFNNGYTGNYNIMGLTDFPSAQTQSISDGNGDWFFYEFSSDGLSMNPGAMVMLSKGAIDPDGKYIINDPYQQLGFVIRRIGNTIAFTDYDEMEEILK